MISYLHPPFWCVGRVVLGNNQDTSKVLRQLVRDGVVLRSGQGGRKVPFTYQARLAERLTTLRRSVR